MPRKRGIKARVFKTLDNADAAIANVNSEAAAALRVVIAMLRELVDEASDLVEDIRDGVQFRTSIDWANRTAITDLIFREEDDEGAD